jgi:hypothetical protein
MGRWRAIDYYLRSGDFIVNLLSTGIDEYILLSVRWRTSSAVPW